MSGPKKPGVTQYLKRETVLSTLKLVGTLGQGTEISFTFLIPPALVADPGALAMGATMAAARGEPWLSFFEPAELTLRLNELSFTRVTHFTPDDANASTLRAVATLSASLTENT